MPKRRDRGSGSIYFDKSRGKWKGELTLDGHPYVKRGATRAQVADKLNELRRQHAAGELVENPKITVGEILRNYVEREIYAKRPSMSATTRDRYRWVVDGLDEVIGKRHATKVTARQVEAALDALAARPLGRDAMRRHFDVLNNALDWAVGRREITFNPAKHAGLGPGIAAEQFDRRSLTPDDARRLLVALDDERNGPLFAMMLLLGLRPGEATAIAWSAIDGHRLTISRAVRHSHGRPEIVEQLKTTRSARVVDMPDDLVAMLDRHRVRQATERLAAATWVHADLVFATPRGGVLDNKQVNAELRAVCERTAIEVDTPKGRRPPTPYELRHSCASLLADRGTPLTEIADLLGTSVRMLERHYRHLLRPSVAAARDHDWRTAQAN